MTSRSFQKCRRSLGMQGSRQGVNYVLLSLSRTTRDVWQKENQMKSPLVLLSVTHFASYLDKPIFSGHLLPKHAPTRFAF
jgi:hypothetical protein